MTPLQQIQAEILILHFGQALFLGEAQVQNDHVKDLAAVEELTACVIRECVAGRRYPEGQGVAEFLRDRLEDAPR